MFSWTKAFMSYFNKIVKQWNVIWSKLKKYEMYYHFIWCAKQMPIHILQESFVFKTLLFLWGHYSNGWWDHLFCSVNSWLLYKEKFSHLSFNNSSSCGDLFYYFQTRFITCRLGMHFSFLSGNHRSSK